MKNKVAFSIILPVYNVEKYLEPCLDSIYNQSFQDFEIIAINDGSTDGSLDILNTYRDKYGKMIIITQENKGLSATRNVGVFYAKGEFICYVDSDDLISPVMLEKIYYHFHETVDMVAYNHIYVDERFELSELDIHKEPEIKPLKGNGKEIYMSLSKVNKYRNMACRICIRRTFLDEIGITFVEGIFYEDVMYTLICYLKAKFMVYIDDELYVYRRREGSITCSTKFAKGADSYISVLAQLIDYLGEEIYDEKIEECILNNIGREMIDGIRSKLAMLRGYHPNWKENEQPYWTSRALNLKMRQEAFNYQYYLKGFERIIRTASGVIVYGAGGIGRTLGKYFKKENMLGCINSYCVTEKEEGFQIEGIEVREIEYITNFDKNILIIIAANATAGEMEKKITNYGYYNYVIIDRLLEDIICNALNSEE